MRLLSILQGDALDHRLYRHAQKKLDELINANLNQQLEIEELRRHITELNAIIETRNLWRDSERRH